jgi:hypothetical protein
VKKPYIYIYIISDVGKWCFFFLIIFFIYNRNPNLNSHTCKFLGLQGSTPRLHRGVRLLEKRSYHWAECPSGKEVVLVY